MVDITTALQIGGAWIDGSDDVREDETITITGGRGNGGGQTDPGSCTLKLNSPNGKYSPRNPLSPYFEQLGRNTPLRVAVPGGRYLYLPGATGDRVTTPDAAPLDVTGDLDVRVDTQLDNWGGTLQTFKLAGKYDSPANQRSWRFLADGTGRLALTWSTTGADFINQDSTAGVPIPASGRIALRVTLDVDDGAGNHVVTFYYADTLAGPWTQLENPHVSAGTTSVFASTTPLQIGDVAGVVGFEVPSGKVYAFELRNGIDGPAVANPDFTAQTVGASSFTDSAGRVWTLEGGTELTDRNVRFEGEVSRWPTKWDLSGADVTVSIQAAGITRRLNQGRKPLASTLRRRVPSYAPLAYWPMEEGENATQAYSPIPGVQPMVTSGLNWAQNDTLPSSGPLPVLASNGGVLPAIGGTVPAPAGTLTGWQVRWIYRLDTPPTTLRTFMRILCTGGTVAQWLVQARDNLSRIIGLDAQGATVFQQDVATSTDLFFQWSATNLRARQDGTSVVWTVTWQDVGGDSGQTSGSFTGTLGRPSQVASPSDGYSSDLDGMALGHIGVFGTETTSAYVGAITAYAGETAWARAQRLCEEEGVPLTMVGLAAGTELVGAQRPAKLLDLLQEAADADGGILHEQRDRVALRYRTRTTLYTQTPALELDFTRRGDIPENGLEPVDDDQRTRNDITVQRAGGSSARVVLETGPLSVQDPPDGVGTYDEAVTLNLHTDDQAEPIAWWLLHLGTQDESRYPQVRVNLLAAPHLVDAATAVNVGDRITIVNPPPYLPPQMIDLIVEGYTEKISTTQWEITFNCSPGGPWNTLVTDAGFKADTDGSELAAAVDATQTSIPVAVTAGPTWTTDPAETPWTIDAGGEQMTVTAVGPSVRDDFSRTTSSGWGSTDTGQAWTRTGGSATDFSVSGGLGRHSLTSVNVSRWSTITAPTADFDVTATVATDKLATGGSHYLALAGRWADTNNTYLARVDFATTQTVALTIRKRVAGTETSLGGGTIAGLTHAAGARFAVRFQAEGSTLRAKVWPATASEPPTWQVEVTDTALTAAGSVGVRSILSSTNTNTLPVEASFDGFQVATPQTFTVVRSANGVIKTHAAGTAVRLAQRSITSL